MWILLLAMLALPALGADREAARRLLDGVPELAAAAPAETAVIALWRAGAAYAQLDKSKAIDYLNQAFSAASALKENGHQYRTEIVKAAADVRLPDAIEMLRGLQEPAAAAERIVDLLAANKDFDQAIEILALTPDSAEYPFHAAGRIFEKLPADDPRRPLVFGRAVSAYAKRLSGPFPELLERYGKLVPRPLVAQAVAAIAARIAGWKDDTSSFSGETSDAGPMEMHSPNQIELRELISVLQQFDAPQAAHILETRADIRGALSGFRKERKPAAPPTEEKEPAAAEGQDLSPPLMTGFAGDLNEFTKRMQAWSAQDDKAKSILETLQKDPRKALEQARELSGGARAEILGRIARSVAAKDPEWARGILDTCLSELREIQDPGERIMPSVAVAGAFHQLKDEQRTWGALRRALSDLALVYRQDTNAEHPNVALRDRWPSIQGCRLVMRSAGRLLGAQAESLLAGEQVIELGLVGRVELARTLLDLPMDVHSIEVRWTGYNK